jgi:ATP/maltotriose-dependent transcriptional regulator MalT
LSDREREIVRLLDEGLSNQAIAERLVITLGTTKWHLNHIYGKLGVKSRIQAVRRAHELKLL